MFDDPTGHSHVDTGGVATQGALPLSQRMQSYSDTSLYRMPSVLLFLHALDAKYGVESDGCACSISIAVVHGTACLLTLQWLPVRKTQTRRAGYRARDWFQESRGFRIGSQSYLSLVCTLLQ